MSDSILDVKDLNVSFKTKYGKATAVNNVGFTLHKGEKLGLVGESGSGKSVTAKSIMRLLRQDEVETNGQIYMEGVDLLSLREKEMRQWRGRRISMIFQEPMVSLNPAYTIGNQLAEALRLHESLSRLQAKRRITDILADVGISDPSARLKQYPFELSGGMRQRVMIAMAILCRPEILIADEPTTALDVTIQAQILDLLNQLNREMGISIIMITHDMGVIAELADRVAVMYAGSIVEQGSVYDIFERPKHPYTKGLLDSIPNYDDSDRPLKAIDGNIPSLYHLPSGCMFHDRCLFTRGLCKKESPRCVQVGNQQVACWQYTDEWGKGDESHG